MQPNSGQEPQSSDVPTTDDVPSTDDVSTTSDNPDLEQQFSSRVELPETAATPAITPQMTSDAPAPETPSAPQTPSAPASSAVAPTPSTPTARPPAPPVAPSAPAPPPVAPSAPAPRPAAVDPETVGAPVTTPTEVPAASSIEPAAEEAAAPAEPTATDDKSETVETPAASQESEAEATAAPEPVTPAVDEAPTAEAPKSEPSAADDAVEAPAAEAATPDATPAPAEEAPVAESPAEATPSTSTTDAPATDAPAANESAADESVAAPAAAVEPVETPAASAGAGAAAPAAEEPAASEPAQEAVPEAPAAEPAAAATPSDDSVEPAAAEAPATQDATTEPAAAAAATPSIGDKAPSPDAIPAAGGAPAAPPVKKVGAYGFESGQLIEGTITEVTEQEVVLDLQFGRIGVINRRHLDLPQGESEATALRVGAPLSGAVLLRDDPQGRAVLSHAWARKQEAWAAIEAAQKSNTPIEAKVSAVVKGGLILDMGIRAFMPASHVDLHHVEDLSEYVGKDVQALVVEVDQQNDKVVLSRRAVLRRAEKGRVAEFTKSLEVGQTHTGRVVTITDFGAFVDVKGVRGLLHMSEMAWHRIERPTDAVQNGQELEVKIISIKKGGKRVGLSIRELTADPIDTVTAGEVVTGTVTRLADFGAFVMVGEGVEGLCHNTELSEHRIFAPEEVVTPGEQIQVKIVSIDKQRRRVDLSVNQAVQY